MGADLLAGLDATLQLEVLAFLLAGVTLGAIFGSLPGLTATMGVAVLTPLTFWVSAEQGLAMLSEDDQAAIFMRLELGMNYEEIADALGKPSSDAARMAVHRAVARMAREIVERTGGTQGLVLMGIHRRGIQIADLLRREIERNRQETHGPLLQRAQELF